MSEVRPIPRSAETRPRPLAPPGLRGLLRIPLFYKILIANAGIVVVGAVLGTLATRHFLAQQTREVSTLLFILLLALAAVALTVGINGLILRVALSPLKLLEQTAARVQQGDLDARVPPSALTDRELERLTATFNAMLDNLESYRQRLRDVAERALDAEEEERKRIARELHDDTAQMLAALLIRLRLARGMDDAQRREQLLEQLRVEVGEAIERVRRFARGLRPPALDELGLVPAVESHIRTLGETAGPSIRLHAQPLDHALAQQAELALYRIVQEALSNAIRHADASQVDVTIERVGDVVRATVADDGRGFDVDAVLDSERTGLGIFGMRERAAYVGGHIELHSQPGLGTRLRAEVAAGSSVPVRA